MRLSTRVGILLLLIHILFACTFTEEQNQSEVPPFDEVKKVEEIQPVPEDVDAQKEQDSGEEKLAQPAVIGTRFINDYLSFLGTNPDENQRIDWVNNSPYSDHIFKMQHKRLLREARMKDPELGLDGDPVLDAQDYPDEGVEVESYDPKSYFLVVKGKNQDNFKVRVQLSYINGQWMINGCGKVNMN